MKGGAIKFSEAWRKLCTEIFIQEQIIIMISMSHFGVNIYPPNSLSAKIVHEAPLRPRPGGNQKATIPRAWSLRSVEHQFVKCFQTYTHSLYTKSPRPAGLSSPPIGSTAACYRALSCARVSGSSIPWSGQWIAGRLDVSTEHNIVSLIQDPSKTSGDTTQAATDFALPEFAILCLMFKYLC